MCIRDSNVTCLQSQQQLQLAQSCSVIVERCLEQQRFYLSLIDDKSHMMMMTTTAMMMIMMTDDDNDDYDYEYNMMCMLSRLTVRATCMDT